MVKLISLKKKKKNYILPMYSGEYGPLETLIIVMSN